MFMLFLNLNWFDILIFIIVVLFIQKLINYYKEVDEQLYSFLNSVKVITFIIGIIILNYDYKVYREALTIINNSNISADIIYNLTNKEREEMLNIINENTKKELHIIHIDK